MTLRLIFVQFVHDRTLAGQADNSTASGKGREAEEEEDDEKEEEEQQRLVLSCSRAGVT